MIGTQAWLERSGGRLTVGERFALVGGLFGALREGFRLRRFALRSGRRETALATFDAPDTSMVQAARSYLVANSGTPMANHSVRTAYWTLFVLHQHGELTPLEIETTWVAALLHDVGLEHPPAKGDFSVGGIEVLKQLAFEQQWGEEQVELASEAIATNLSARVDANQSGKIAWAMNVGGLGELGFGLHRAQMHRDRIAELEAQYPRTGFREESKALIRAESRRVPGGRFAFFRWVFPLLMKR
jgi:hypothetical protein